VEIELETLFRRGIELTPVVVIITADLRALVVDAAGASRTQVFAAALKQKKPPVIVLVDLDPMVGNLP
jgi:hypothetical protein